MFNPLLDTPIRSPRSQFEHQKGVGLDERLKGLEINFAASGRQMIVYSDGIMQVNPEQMVAIGFEEASCRYQPQRFLSVGMPGIVPVPDRAALEFLKKSPKVLVAGQFVVMEAVFQTQTDACGVRSREEKVQAAFQPSQIGAFQFAKCRQFFFDESADLGGVDFPLAVVPVHPIQLGIHRYSTAMEYNGSCTEHLGIPDGPLGAFDSSLPLFRIEAHERV